MFLDDFKTQFMKLNVIFFLLRCISNKVLLVAKMKT
jgi:hypothetical protein